MSSFIFRNESKVVDGVEVFRIEADEDIPLEGVKVGDLGGFVCKDSILTRGSWVDYFSVVINSTLTEARVLNDSIVRGSNVANSEIANSSLNNSDVSYSKVKKGSILYNARVEQSTIEDSSLCLKNSDAESFEDYYKVRDATLRESKFVSSGKGVDKFWVVKTHLVNALIVGRGIKLIRLKDEVDSLKITGKNIVVMDIGSANLLSIEGSNIELNNMVIMDKVSVKAKKLKVNGYGYGVSSMISVDIHVKEGIIEGRFNLKSVEIRPNQDSEAPSDFTIFAQPVEITDSVFTGDTFIKGDHLILNSAFRAGLRLEGKSELTRVRAIKDKANLSGDIIVGHTLLVGYNNVIRDYAKVLGLKDTPIQLHDSVVVSEFAVIDNSYSESNKEIILDKQTIRGDTFIS